MSIDAFNATPSTPATLALATVAESSHDGSDGTQAPPSEASASPNFMLAECLLRHLAQRHRKPHQLWAARLATFMLLRVGEVALLEANDLEQRERRWFIHVRRSSIGPLRAPLARCVPVPDALIAAGFVAYAQRVSVGRLFPELARSASPWSTVEQWIPSQARRHENPALHGWRYPTLVRAGRAIIEASPGGLYAAAAMRGEVITAWLPEEVAAYEAQRNPTQLAAFIDQVRFPLIGGPVVPRPARLQWQGQRVVQLGQPQ